MALGPGTIAPPRWRPAARDGINGERGANIGDDDGAAARQRVRSDC